MLQRLIFERIEQRIVVGILAFLATMVLVGWIAINEGGRMAAFEEQYLARSIERGAMLYNANCSTCHGPDGRGLAGRAPALNSPYLFGHDFLAEFDSEIDSLNIERQNPNTTAERIVEIDARLTELNAQRQTVIDDIAQTIANTGGDYDPEAPSRLTNLGWGGSLRSFVYTTLVHGRPLSGLYWNGQQMVAWGQTAGGPLRGDQLEDLTNYILNWDKGSAWMLDDLYAVRQFPITPRDINDPAIQAQILAGAGAEINLINAAAVPPEQLDLAAIDAELANFVGDPTNGQVLYNGQLACAGCHLAAAVAPPLEGTWTRTIEVRLQDPANAGLTGEQYLAHSIIHPNLYISPGAPYIAGSYPAGVMPQNFSARLSYQELADLVAYLKSQDQPIGG